MHIFQIVRFLWTESNEKDLPQQFLLKNIKEKEDFFLKYFTTLH